MLFRKNVFILGAGFSADAGAPVMSNFLQKARQLLDDRESGLHEHFGERRFVPVKSSAVMYIVNVNVDQQGGLAGALGQFQEGFSREKIEASGFQVR